MQLLKTRATLVEKLIIPWLGNTQNRPCLSVLTDKFMIRSSILSFAIGVFIYHGYRSVICNNHNCKSLILSYQAK